MTSVRRLHRQHFVYLRACAEGLSRLESAKRFLGLEDGRRVHSMHMSIANDLRALAKRLGEHDWRLIGATISEAAASPLPTLEEWADSSNLLDWSQSELLEMYQATFPEAMSGSSRRRTRNARLRHRQLELLRKLEPVVATAAAPADPIEDWLPNEAPRLLLGGLMTIGQLALAIASGRQWWRSIRGFGRIKAARLTTQLEFLFPDALLPQAAGGLVVSRIERLMAGRELSHLGAPGGTNRSASRPLIPPNDDREAVECWLVARAGRSPLTRSAYRREAERFLLWCAIERDMPLSSTRFRDCNEYIEFLQSTPDGWISREKAPRYSPGWTPFRGKLSPSSQRHALGLVKNLFQWLTEQQYLHSNPWDQATKLDLSEDRRSDWNLSCEGWAALLEAARNQGEAGAGRRNAFLLRFLRCTGLRISEVHNRTLSQLQKVGANHYLDLSPKAGRQRRVRIGPSGLAALTDYLNSRALPFPSPASNGHLPLVASTIDPSRPVTYDSLYWGFRDLARRAALTAEERVRVELERASTFWLRRARSETDFTTTEP